MTTKQRKPVRAPKLTPSELAWIKTRKSYLRRVKADIRQRLGIDGHRELTEFSARYQTELRKPWSVSTQNELRKRIRESNLIYGADFHALAQAQRAHVRILRELDEPVTLALECFQKSSQRFLDQFVAGEITLDELRKKTRWDQTWGFAWAHYRPLLELAKERGFALLALNSKPRRDDLNQRETEAAKLIAKAWRTDSPLYVLFGESHLASTHLPAKVQAEMKRRHPNDLQSVRPLTVHLNSDRVYFQLAERRLETEVDVVRFSETSFCVLSTPPWVKWQSYVLFLDQTKVKKTSQRRGRAEDPQGEVDHDSTDQVATFVRMAANDLELESRFKNVNDLAVYDEGSEAIWYQVEKRIMKSDRPVAQSLLRSGQPFYLPASGFAYQPKPTINSTAALAGLYLHAKVSGRLKSLWNFPRDFRALVWVEAVSYFISKMINHSRRAATVSGLQTQLKLKACTQAKSENLEALRLALDFRLTESMRTRKMKRALTIQPRQTSSYVEASRILGGMLGERLYLAYRSRKLKRDTLLTWLKHDPGGRSFASIYAAITEQIHDWSAFVESLS